MKSLRNVSASQVKSFVACERKWWLDRSSGQRVPPSMGILRGRGADYGVQCYLEGKPIPDDVTLKAKAVEREDLDAQIWVWSPQQKCKVPSTVGIELEREHDWTMLVKAAIPHLPKPGARGVRVQKKIVVATGPGLPPWIGFIDWDDVPEVWDLKTTTDFRYCKTPEDLQRDHQMMSYAKAEFDEDPSLQSLCVAHLYVETFSPGEKVPARGPAAKVVSVDVTRAHVEHFWRTECIPHVPRMVDTARKTSLEQVAPTGAAKHPKECDAYGGCAYRQACGLDSAPAPGVVGRLLSGPKRARKENTMGTFAEKLAARRAEMEKSGAVPTTKAEAAAPAPEPEPTVPTGVLAPDAAPRDDTPLAAGAAAPEKKPRKSREKKAKDASASEQQTVAAPAEEVRGVVGGAIATGFQLYVDCYPTKGAGPAVLFDDWFADLEREMNATALADAQVKHYMLLDFGSQKALLSMTLGARVEGGLMPPSMVLDTRSAAARDALSVLTPFATAVVRALR